MTEPVKEEDQELHTEAHRLPIDKIYSLLDTSAEGLTESQARERLLQYGTNELQSRQNTPEYIKFLRQFKNFFAILLLIGSGLALIAEELAPNNDNFYVAVALFAVVVLNATFTYLQEHQSEKIMESFRKMLPQMVTVLRNGKEKKMLASRVIPGDVMLLAEGDRICADGRLIEQNRMKVDLSSLTGESEPELRHLECTHTNILISRNMVFSGTLVQSGNGRAVVYATGMNTQIGQIVKLTKETAEAETPIRKELKHFIQIISVIAIILGVVFFLVSILLGKGTLGSLIFAIGIIVANVPEGLLPTVTLALTMASKRMARKNALVKQLESIETLGSTTVICTDKTGTLTQNRISVNTVIFDKTEYAAWDHRIRTVPGIERARDIMVLCNNAHLQSRDRFTGDPTEGALLVYANELNSLDEYEYPERLHEYPFDSATKRMITVTGDKQANGMYAWLKGAPEVVLKSCSHVYLNGEKIPLQDRDRQHIIADYQRLARRGERVLALAMKETDDDNVSESGFEFICLIGMLDPPRHEVFGAINKCRRAGIKVIMITGDYGLTAESIGRQIGLLRGAGKVVRGEELYRMSDSELSEVLDQPEIIFARTSPKQKLRIVKALQAKGEVVTVTGDGVNDAPALKNADMGVAMGIMGTDVAKEASNMVLMDDNFATIVSAVEEGRTIFDNIKKFITYILTSNIPEILPFIAYVILDIPLPLTVVLILSIDLGTDLLPALGLGSESAEVDVMNNKPRPREERLLTQSMLIRSYGIIGMIEAAAGFFSYFIVLYHGGWSWGQQLAADDILYKKAITAFFASIIICQIANVMICRTRRQSMKTVRIFDNRLILLGIASELFLLGVICYVPPANIFFGTAPLSWWHFLLSVPFALVILVLAELRRKLLRNNNAFVMKWLAW